MPKYTKLPVMICMDTGMAWNYPEENWKSIYYPQSPTTRPNLTKIYITQETQANAYFCL